MILRHSDSDLGQVETEETENGSGKLKRKTEAEIGNEKAEIGKWSSTFVALMLSFAHARSVWGYNNIIRSGIASVFLSTSISIA